MDDKTCLTPQAAGAIDYTTAPNPAEICVIEVLPGGQYFTNFESVMVHRRWKGPWPDFQFTTADIVEVEGETPPDNWRQLQFKPGDECAIYLGGQLAVAGVITARQTAYDKGNKQVSLTGVGLSWYAARGSILNKTNFDNESFLQIAGEVLQPFGIDYCTVGKIDGTPFTNIQVETGETVWNFLERIARDRQVVIGSDHQGKFVFISLHIGDTIATLREGDNILGCQALIATQDIYSNYPVRGQTVGHDDKWGPPSAEMEASAPGSAKRYSPILNVVEHPVYTVQELQERANFEQKVHEGQIVEVTVVVQGWFVPPGGNMLWAPGYDVLFDSPMTTLRNVTLKIDTVTFKQDSSGTTTTLLLVAPWALMDQLPLTEDSAANPAPAPSPTQQPAAPATQPIEPPPPTFELGPG